MEGQEELASTINPATSVFGEATPGPPVQEPVPDLEISPVGSPDDGAEAEIEAPPSDEDHHHDADHDHKAGTGPLSDDLKRKIIKQVEYYFSDENLATDKHLINMIKKNKEGFVSIGVIASFRKMKKLTRDYSFIVAALRESSLLVVSGDGERVKRLNQIRFNESRDSKSCTVLVENLPEDHSRENIRKIFGGAGNIKKISLHDPHAMEEGAKRHKQELLMSTKLHALIEYETIEAAEKVVATLNDEQDWRNGMRVKLLKRMAKYGQKKQVRRESDSEKNNTSRVPEQTGDNDNHDLKEHNNDTPDEEDGEHLKDKTGHRGRNRGRARKHKYHGLNGMGHGSSSSTHAMEPSKPPPGPKMPDGTRGFTIGRGRSPISNPS
ncbi:La-related protein like [Quillaja saponaria]|uniref:La-related protein like n=1 Tax=Quillaja saponaria TaxID=32244 RepID=A0AAD7M2U9_QUISA|nr:La-related protein like [Quillaja saponaria]